MAYEYRSGSQTLELPNPYKAENQIRFFLGAIYIAAAIGLLLLFRARMSEGWNASSLIPLLCSVFLLMYAIVLIARGMMQLRFFFGRDRPGELLPSEANNAAPAKHSGADYLREIIRRGALHFPEPNGALNGLLYHLQPNLIFAPLPLRNLAQQQFRTALTALAILASFLMSWLLLSQHGYDQILGAFYLVLATIIVFKPVKDSGTANPSNVLPVLLILAAVVGPVLITLLHPPTNLFTGIQFFGATLAVLLLIAIGTTLFVLALRSQLGNLPPASSSMHQLAASMNCQPSQLIDELSRKLQEQWQEQIPNREYLKSTPQINLSTEASGTFAAEMLEESQPIPEHKSMPRNFREFWHDPKRRSPLILQLFGASLLLVAALLICIGASLNTIERVMQAPSSIANFTLFAFTFFIAGHHCFKGAHLLFGRFDFESKIYWFECNGSYQVASLDFGNVLSDRLKTRKNLINIETATVRVWIVELYSCAFDASLVGRPWARYATAMIGCKQEAQVLAESLVAFAQDQSIVVAPTSAHDAQKAHAMASLGTGTAAGTRDSVAAIAALNNADKPSE